MGRRSNKPATEAPAANSQPVPTAAPVVELKRVVFKRDHTHACVDYHEGDTIHVTPDTADLLRLFDAIGGE